MGKPRDIGTEEEINLGNPSYPILSNNINFVSVNILGNSIIYLEIFYVNGIFRYK